MKINFRKIEPKIGQYKNYNNFTNELFRENLVNQLSISEINKNDRGLEFFEIYGEACFVKEEIY